MDEEGAIGPQYLGPKPPGKQLRIAILWLLRACPGATRSKLRLIRPEQHRTESGEAGPREGP